MVVSLYKQCRGEATLETLSGDKGYHYDNQSVEVKHSSYSRNQRSESGLGHLGIY